jgi:hypothetical protein
MILFLFALCIFVVWFCTYGYTAGARGGAVGRGTAVPARRSRVPFPMVSLKFFVDVIFPAALWPWSRLSLLQKWVRRAYRTADNLTTFMRRLSRNSGSFILLEPSGPAQACTGIVFSLRMYTLFVCVLCWYCTWLKSRGVKIRIRYFTTHGYKNVLVSAPHSCSIYLPSTLCGLILVIFSFAK